MVLFILVLILCLGIACFLWNVVNVDIPFTGCAFHFEIELIVFLVLLKARLLVEHAAAVVLGMLKTRSHLVPFAVTALQNRLIIYAEILANGQTSDGVPAVVDVVELRITSEFGRKAARNLNFPWQTIA